MKKIIIGFLFCCVSAQIICDISSSQVVEFSSDWNNKYFGKFTYEEYREQVKRWYEVAPWYQKFINKTPKYKMFLEGKVGGVPPIAASTISRWASETHDFSQPFPYEIPFHEEVVPASLKSFWGELRMYFYKTKTYLFNWFKDLFKQNNKNGAI